jgi:hypothetical protein
MAPKILLIDIETAPTIAYIWDLFTRYVPHSQVVEPGYTLCYAAKWYGEAKRKVIYQSVHKDGEQKMIEGAHALLDEADIVLHFNGTKYDIPKLNTEFLQWELGPPAPFQEIDLYRTAKKRFKLLSNSMAYVAKTLGIEGRVSHKGMELWTECMAGDDKAWRHMERYNKQDVYMLEEIYDCMLPWIQPHPNVALYVDDNEPMCPHCGGTHLQRRGHYFTNTLRYPRWQCMNEGCGKWSRSRGNNLSSLKKQNLLVGVK